MPSKIDLTGKKFGRWTVLKQGNKKGRRLYWLCKCECGTIKEVSGESLRSGKSKSCGCLRNEKTIQRNKQGIKDLTGQIFGHLTVLKYAGYSHRGHAVWTCQCDCGNIKDIVGMDLTRGDITSCGCQRYKSIGELKIKEILINNNIKFQTEYSFNDLKSQNNIPYRFDFAILDQNKNVIRLIQYDGEQHFLEKANNFFKKDTLQHRQKVDNIKNQYCLRHKIPLVRIPYWEKDNISLDYLLSNKFLIK